MESWQSHFNDSLEENGNHQKNVPNGQLVLYPYYIFSTKELRKTKFCKEVSFKKQQDCEVD